MTSSILDLFEESKLVKICAPMVRYSKLQFRSLVREYGCNLCYTPMIMADSFCKSEKARLNEFTTNKADIPLVVQFGAKTVHDFVGATYMIIPYSNGVELNCGCPQRWAIADGYGCALLSQPEMISDLIHQCRACVPQNYTISAKIRLLAEEIKTVQLCQNLEKSGVSYIVVHGRTPLQRHEPINMEMLSTIKKSVRIPVVANGDVKTLDDAHALQQTTGCDGVMVARGILTNPALFAGYNKTPMECVQKWLNICYNSVINLKQLTVNSELDIINNFPQRHSNLTFQSFHHHLVFMLEKLLSKKQRQVFNNIRTFSEVLLFLFETFNIVPEVYPENLYLKNRILDLNYEGRNKVYLKLLTDSKK